MLGEPRLRSVEKEVRLVVGDEDRFSFIAKSCVLNLFVNLRLIVKCFLGLQLAWGMGLSVCSCFSLLVCLVIADYSRRYRTGYVRFATLNSSFALNGIMIR